MIKNYTHDWRLLVAAYHAASSEQMVLTKVVVLPLLVATAHGLNGLWPEAVTKPVESYPGSSDDCHDGLSCRACLTAGCGFFGSCLPSCDMIADVACYEGDAEKRCAAYEASQRDSKLCDAAIPNPNPSPNPSPNPNPNPNASPNPNPNASPNPNPKPNPSPNPSPNPNPNPSPHRAQLRRGDRSRDPPRRRATCRLRPNPNPNLQAQT